MKTRKIFFNHLSVLLLSLYILGATCPNPLDKILSYNKAGRNDHGSQDNLITKFDQKDGDIKLSDPALASFTTGHFLSKVSDNGAESEELQSPQAPGMQDDLVMKPGRHDPRPLLVTGESGLNDNVIGSSPVSEDDRQNTFREVESDTHGQSNITGDNSLNLQPSSSHDLASEQDLTDGSINYDNTALTDSQFLSEVAHLEQGGLEYMDDTSSYVSKFELPIDYFRCGPCSCHQLANSSFSHARCKNLHPRLQEIPQNLPKNIFSFNIAVNIIRHLSFASLSTYEFLQYVNISSNRISRITNRTCGRILKNIRHLDLSDNRISSIDEGSFLCTPALAELNLSKNLLQLLTGSFLRGLVALKQLNVARNRLTDIQMDAFNYCPHLKILKLDNNKRLTYGKKILKPGIFKPLRKLEVLHIQGWRYSFTYPLTSLMELTNLRELNIDGLPEGFDATKANFTKLSTLLLGVRGNCHTKNLTDSYFQGMPNLRRLHIEQCSFDIISPSAFKRNDLLEDFGYTEIDYNFDDAFESLSGLKDKPIKKLTLNHLKRGMKDSPCRYLGHQHVEHIHTMTHLQELNIEFNLISLITRDFIYKLPHNITTLNVRRNMLSYLRSILRFKKAIESLQNLVTLQEDMQNQVIYFPSEEPETFASHATRQCRQPLLHRTSLRETMSDRDTAEEQVILNDESHTLVGYDIPEKLQFYSASQSFRFGQAFLSPRSTPKNNVHVLNISGSFYTDFGTKTLSPWLKVADLSYNFCDVMSNSFFRLNNSLEMLILAGNFLGDVFIDDFDGNKLSRLSRLKYLDISKNRIQSLPKLFFTGLKNLRILDLSGNSLASVDLELSHMKGLQFLNLRKNSVWWISKKTRDDLDNLWVNHSPVSIDLTSNALPCTCEGLELLIWLASTNVRIINKDFLHCHDEDEKIMSLMNLQETVEALKRRCKSKVTLILIASFFISIVVMMLVTVWVFRNRWWIYYIKNKMITKVYGYKPDSKGQQYQFDAYILYSKHDSRFVLKECTEELEKKRGHRMCVEDRDFLVGCIMPTTITSAISSSKTTLAVVSPEFWESEWCEYAVQMATLEAAHAKRKVLHLLIYKPVPLEKIPQILLKVHQDNKFTEYPPEDCSEDFRTTFWDAISCTIGHIPRGEGEPGADSG